MQAIFVTSGVCNVTCVFIEPPTSIIYSSPGLVVVVSHKPAPLMRQLGSDKERIIVPFFSKGVNHMAYLARVVTVVSCVCYCLSNSYGIVFRHNQHSNYRPQFQDRQKPHPLISRRAVRRRHYRPRILRKLPGR